MCSELKNKSLKIDTMDVHPFIRFTCFPLPRCCKQMIDIEPPTHKHLGVSQVVFVIYTLLRNTQVSGLTGPINQYK